MRVSSNMGYEQVKGNIQKNRSEVADLQNQASSMKRITRPSDDPIGTAKMLGIRTEGTNNEQFLKNMNMARSFLNYTDLSLGEATEIVMRAKELALGQASDASASAASRQAVAAEIEQLHSSLVNVANRRLGERFIFGGYKTTNNPFNMEGEYKGDDGRIKIEIGKGIFTTVNVPGEQAFLGKDYKLASVPENRRGATTPNYPAPPPSNKETQEVEIRGPASTDKSDKPGAEKSEEKKTQNSVQNNSQVNIEQEGPTKSGENIFKTLEALSAGLRANDTVAIQETLERLDTAIEQVVILRSQVGSRVASLENSFEGLTKGKIEDLALLSSIEDADAFEVFTDITKDENTLKATLQTSGKLIQPSLLDFLR